LKRTGFGCGESLGIWVIEKMMDLIDFLVTGRLPVVHCTLDSLSGLERLGKQRIELSCK